MKGRYDVAKKLAYFVEYLQIYSTNFVIFSPYESTLPSDDGSLPHFPICQGTLPWQPNNIAVMKVSCYYVHSLQFARWQHNFVSLYYLLEVDTAAPSRLYARLCHTFLVFNDSLIRSFIRDGGWTLAVFRRTFQPTDSAEA